MMTDTSLFDTRIAELETQFDPSLSLELTNTRRHARAWVVALGVSVALWVGIIAGVVAIVHAIS